MKFRVVTSPAQGHSALSVSLYDRNHGTCDPRACAHPVKGISLWGQHLPESHEQEAHVAGKALVSASKCPFWVHMFRSLLYRREKQLTPPKALLLFLNPQSVYVMGRALSVNYSLLRTVYTQCFHRTKRRGVWGMLHLTFLFFCPFSAIFSTNLKSVGRITPWLCSPITQPSDRARGRYAVQFKKVAFQLFVFPSMSCWLSLLLHFSIFLQTFSLTWC